MKHPIKQMIENRRNGKMSGIPSYCSANELVLEAALSRAKAQNTPVLIEATANQVNQFGGYTGLRPKEFYQMIHQMAQKAGVSDGQLLLGGDHLGPLIWQDLKETEAMNHSAELVFQYARAGFTKIHLDTSMKVADDPDGLLSTKTIAQRGIILYQAALNGFMELKKERPEAIRPVFVIGSEVPIPGGAQEAEDSLAVTKPEAFLETAAAYKRAFLDAGIEDGWKDIAALVVQPGVEFGDDQVFPYDHEAAAKLCAALSNYPEICFEGHSTDYQSAENLREMVQDGIAILKVGPALTFGLREALFSLSFMEKELVPQEQQAHVIETLEALMLKSPDNWKKHYHGDEKQLALARKYSFSDRCRYYIGQPEAAAAIDRLFDNLREYPLPMNMLHQFMPLSYEKVRGGLLPLDPRDLAMDGAARFMEDYEAAVRL